MLFAISTILTFTLMVLKHGASKTAVPLVEIKAMAPIVQVVKHLQYKNIFCL